MRPATSGTVCYENRDLYRDYGELRHRIGLVPQEDVLHRVLMLVPLLDASGEVIAGGRVAYYGPSAGHHIRHLDGADPQPAQP